MPGPTVLLCTVGGSPQPIETAIRTLQPSRVVFLVSSEGGRDNLGSRPEAERIATDLELSPGSYAIEPIAADDPEAAGLRCAELVRRERKAKPSARLVCDYTGGTKTMSAALLTAAIAEPQTGIVLQFMRGERRDLHKVAAGTERPVQLAVDALLAERALAMADRFWGSYAYAEAEALLQPHWEVANSRDDFPEGLQQRLTLARAASAMLAAWDRFEHARALSLYNHHKLAKAGKELARLRQPLQRLASSEPEKRMPLLLLDLWHNAERRAARGQYDDAVARCYRLVEATVQHLLGGLGIETSAVDLARLPEAVRDKWARELGAKRQAGLVKAWTLFSEIRPEHPASRALSDRFAGRRAVEELQLWIEQRNLSLLAHGFAPVGETGWERTAAWMRQVWCGQIWRSIAGELRDEFDLPQLPTSLSGLTEGL